MRNASLTVELRSDLSEIGRLSGALEAFAEANDVPPDVLMAVNLALEELVTNTISYGFDAGAGHAIQVALSIDGDTLTAVVQDDGKEYNPFLREDPDVSVGLEERAVGGLGVMLVRQLMDSTAYQRRDGRNVVTIMKRTGGGQAEPQPSSMKA